MTDMSFAREQLRSVVERIERLESEIAEMNADKRDIYAEAKGNGFDTKVLKKIIADRRKDMTEREEFEAVYDLYAQALGMAPQREVEVPSRAPARAREEKPKGVDTVELPSTPSPIKVNDQTDPLYFKRLRPHCQADRSEDCPSYGDRHCTRCTKLAKAAKEAEAA